MRSSSSKSYDLPERVRSYDADMEIMHPLRWKMIDIALEVLPSRPAPLTALDLGTGTGVFTKRFLEKHPAAKVVAVDGAASMLDLARTRLGDLARRVEWVVSDFQALPSDILRRDSFDVVISSFALHHLNAEEKLAVLKSVVHAMKPGGWFLNADIVVAQSPDVERRIQDLRIDGIVERASNDDQRFLDFDVTRQFIDELETKENDQPQTLEKDLQIFRASGIPGAEVLWREYREVVIGGPKEE